MLLIAHAISERSWKRGENDAKHHGLSAKQHFGSAIEINGNLWGQRSEVVLPKFVNRTRQDNGDLHTSARLFYNSMRGKMDMLYRVDIVNSHGGTGEQAWLGIENWL